jgi:hypothetical protein
MLHWYHFKLLLPALKLLSSIPHPLPSYQSANPQIIHDEVPNPVRYGNGKQVQDEKVPELWNHVKRSY